MVRAWLLSLVIISTSFLTSCTRDVGKTSKLTLSMPSTPNSKVAGQTFNGTLGHVVVNVSGPGIPSTILNSWDSHECPSGNCPFPSDYIIEVPSGASRVIQVLGVYRSANGAMLFAYGDVTKNLSSGVETAVIDLVGLNSTASSGGNIVGRYYDPMGFTPTSTINVKYTPPGKPTMVVERSEMFAGWFNVFGLQDLALTYELDTGHVMFGGPINLQGGAFTAAGIYRLTVPAHSRMGNGSTQSEAGALLNFGFFGTPPSGTGCKPGSYTFVSRVDPNTSAGLSFPSMFSHAGAVSACTGTEYVNYVTLSPALYDNNGNDSIGGFRGPFKKVSSSQMVTVSGTTIDWDYMPNIDSSVIDGVRFFMKPNSSGNEFNGNIDCMSLPSRGFAVVGDAMMPASDFTSAAFSNVSNAAIVGCPFKGAKLFKSVLKTSVSGGGGGAPTQLAVVKTQQPFGGVGEYSCTEFAVELRDANGMLTSHPSPINFNLTSNADSMYADQQLCNSSGAALQTGVTLPPVTSRFIFWARIPSIGTETVVNLTLGYSGSPTLSVSNLSVPVKAYSDKTWIFDGPTKVLPDLCYSAEINFSQYDGYGYMVGPNTTVDLTSTGVSLYSNSGCTTTATSVTITGGTYGALVYYKVNSGTGVKSVTMTASAGEVTSDPSTVYFQIGSGNQTPASLFVSDLGFVPNANDCVGPFVAKILNSNGVVIPLSSAGNLSINGGAVNMDVFSNMSCTTALSASVPAGKHEIEFYVRGNNVGHGVITANLNGAIGTRNVDMNGFHHLNLTMVEASPVPHGTCVEFTIETRDLFDAPIGILSQVFNLTSNTSIQFFKTRLSNMCLNPISSITPPNYASPMTVYAMAINMTSSTASVTATVSTAGAINGVVNFNIPTPPTLVSVDTVTQNISEEYPFNLVKTIEMFTGVAPFNFNKIFGAGSLVAANYTSSGGDSAQFNIVDSRTPTATTVVVDTATVAKTATLDFTSSLPSGVTLTRSSNAHYYDSAGYMVSVASDVPRFGFNPDPASSFAPLGLLVEGQATNLIPYSEDFSVTWDCTNTMAPCTAATAVTNPKGASGGGNGVYLLSDSNENAFNAGRAWYQFSSDLTNDMDYVGSVYVKSNTSQYVGLMMQENGVTSSGVILNLSTGQVQKMEGPYTPQTLNSFGVQKLPNGWYRLWQKYHSSYSCVNGGSGPCQGSMVIFPALIPSSPSDTTGTGSVYVFGAQIEQNKVMSSYIKTTGATGTRQADNVTMAINGTNINGWNSSYGSLRIEAFNLTGTIADYGTYVDMCYSSCSTNQLQVRRYSGGGSNYFVRTGGVQQNPWLTLNLPQPENAMNRIGVSWATGSQNAINMGVNGEIITSGNASISAPPLTSGTMYIGNSGLGNDSAHAHIKKIEYWPAKLSAPALGSF